MPMPKAMENVLENGKALARNLGEQIRHIPETATPNYVMSASAASLCALIYASSSFEGCNSSYLALAGCLLSAGVAINQYGFQRTVGSLTNGVHSLFSGKAQTTQTQNVADDHPLATTTSPTGPTTRSRAL